MVPCTTPTARRSFAEFPQLPSGLLRSGWVGHPVDQSLRHSGGSVLLDFCFVNWDDVMSRCMLELLLLSVTPNLINTGRSHD